MSRSRQKIKGRKESGSFISIPKQVLESEQYASLRPHSVKLLIDLAAQYNGKNNGDLCAAWSMMEKRGWRSKGTLYRAVRQLLKTEFIQLTQQGGKHKPSLYAVTFKAVDECNGKLEIKATAVAANTWKQIRIRAPGEY